jgi:GT2 family glycosyltransferase
MKVAIACVNYNSYNSLNDYLLSINKASGYLRAKDSSFSVSVLVADNSENKQEINSSQLDNIECVVTKCENLGYLGGAFKVINEQVDRNSFDITIISNVDVVINEDFFEQLQKIDKNMIGWIAPGIYRPNMHKVLNVEWRSRPSVKRMKLYSYLFSHPAIYSLYFLVSRLKLKTTQNEVLKKEYIYAGYGSFMIFTKEFIALNEQWHYEPFLFGEEIFFGEVARLANLKVLYVPTLQITDVGKVSTGRMNAIGKLKVQKESNDYLLKTFFTQ